MSLQIVELDWHAEPPPSAESAELIRDARERIERFFHDRPATDPIPSFVVCDFEMADQAIRAIVDAGLAPGPVFCEWGAGFAVVSGLAAQHGMFSYGIEIHRDLVEQARRLLADHHVEVELAQGSLVPEGGDVIVDEMASQDWLKTNEHPAYDELDMDVCDFDLIFAYPWPGEEELIEALFDAFAADGALLLTYHGMNEIKLQRKVQDSSGED